MWIRNAGRGCATVVLAALICTGVNAELSKSSKKKPSDAKHSTTKTSTRSSSKKSSSSKKTAASTRRTSSTAHKKSRARRVTVHSVPTEQSRKLSSAFVASERLRPMAQQLAATRSAAAYAGVRNWASTRTGEAASAAYLALGHAYMLDHKYSDAQTAFRTASQTGKALDDYAAYLGAQAALQAGHTNDAQALLTGFAQRFPESVFTANAPVMLANAYLQQNNAQMALVTLNSMTASAVTQRNDFQYAKARALQLAGQPQQAATIYRSLYANAPLSYEAGQSATQLNAMSMGLSAAERKIHADKLFNAKRYAEAGAEYHAIGKSGALSQADQDALEVYEAVCDMKQKKLSRHEADKLPATSDDSAAAKLYILAEIARSEKDQQQNRNYIQELIERFPHSRWLEEALYSGGNMYLLVRDNTNAIFHYKQLYTLFPHSLYAPSAHWRVAWMNYRVRNYAEAARLMEEQITKYPLSNEAVAALYWRGRLYEDPEKNFAQAANFYRTLSETYSNYYYAILARERLKVIGNQPAVAPSFVLKSVQNPAPPTLVDELPENDPHLIKARLLANAALNEYIGPEIQASPTAGEWGTLAEAEIYSSYGETWRSLRAMKKSGVSFLSMDIDDIPHKYWELLFPRPFWDQIKASSAAQGLDPYMVAALIRQETEFNPGAVSRANAMGLMQLLPSSGKAEAKRLGIKGFHTQMLLNPSINIQLGTSYLKRAIDRFNEQPVYVYAAYNAGDTPVRAWMAANDYRDIAEFVDSIPYSETREYVQALIRNRELYRQIYAGK
ncbi:MAG: transglycosylase SLT domain-containing protein [Acidobacteria bacterium]|nr:transglycosylase SLT domain-containing protein [Acidobacteriota bacterium]